MTRNDDGINVLTIEEPPAPRRRKNGQKASLTFVKKTKWPKKREQELKKALKDRRRTGHSIEKIAKQFKVSPGAIRQKSFAMRISAYGKPM